MCLYFSFRSSVFQSPMLLKYTDFIVSLALQTPHRKTVSDELKQKHWVNQCLESSWTSCVVKMFCLIRTRCLECVSQSMKRSVECGLASAGVSVHHTEYFIPWSVTHSCTQVKKKNRCMGIYIYILQRTSMFKFDFTLAVLGNSSSGKWINSFSRSEKNIYATWIYGINGIFIILLKQ